MNMCGKALLTVVLTLTMVTGAKGEASAQRIRDALSGALGGTLCAASPTWAGWCAVLGMEAAFWVDQGVSIAIDRHFESQDQEFANKHNLTICYNDGRCIKPK